MNTLPPDFLEKLSRIFPHSQRESCLNTFSQPFMTTFWINSLLANPDEIIKEIRDFSPTPLSWHTHAFTVAPHFKRVLTETFIYQQGKIYILNASSLLPPWVLDAKPGEEVLDLAAAPGGKTIQVAASMRNQGRIAAVEVIKDRFFRLKSNLKQAGVTIAQLYLKDGRSVGKACPERFDRILLDAPCSSEARFKTDDPSTYAYWSPRKIKEMQRKQIGLLNSAVLALKPGGTLVYCTCSFSPEENEVVIEQALKKFPSLYLEEFQLPIDNVQAGLTEKTKLAKRILPTDIYEGFFICKLKKLT